MSDAVNFRADLHCHSTCSDGTVSPQDLVQLACDRNLQGLSITDHDTIDAYREAVPAAQRKNLPLISGVEFSAAHNKTSVHILAYGFPLDSSVILEFCEKHSIRRTHRLNKMLELLAAHGMPLVDEDFPADVLSSAHHSIGRPHIAAAMIKKGYIQTIQQGFNEFLGDGKPCFVTGETFSAEETIDLIHSAKGLAVIAHPHLIDNTKVLHSLLEMNFDGIEGYYGRFPSTAHERWIKIGMRKGWIITGGSDFHGEIKPNLPLGSSWVNEETFGFLLNHFNNNQNKHQ